MFLEEPIISIKDLSLYKIQYVLSFFQLMPHGLKAIIQCRIIFYIMHLIMDWLKTSKKAYIFKNLTGFIAAASISILLYFKRY